MSYSTDDTLFEIAQEIFDDEVLVDEEYFDMFNVAPQEVKDELLEIVGAMCHDAISAMLQTAASHRDMYQRMLIERSAA